MKDQFLNESGVQPKGWVTVKHVNAFGDTIKEFEVPNMVVTSGKNHIAQRLSTTDVNTPARMNYMSIGQDNTAPALGQTILGQELARATCSGVNTANNTVTYTATFDGAESGAITEAGIFNAAGSNGGTMLCRTVFPEVNKQSGDTITVTWKVTIS